MGSTDELPAESTTTTSSIPPSTEASPSHKSNGSTAQPAHQRLVFTDPVAFRYVLGDIEIRICSNGLL